MLVLRGVLLPLSIAWAWRQLDLSKTVMDTIKDAADGKFEYEQLRALLGQFLFKGDTVNKPLEALSVR